MLDTLASARKLADADFTPAQVDAATDAVHTAAEAPPAGRAANRVRAVGGAGAVNAGHDAVTCRTCLRPFRY